MLTPPATPAAARARRIALVGVACVAGLFTLPSPASAFVIEFHDGVSTRSDMPQPDWVYGTRDLTLRVTRGGATLQGSAVPYGNGIGLPELRPGDVAALITPQGSVAYSAAYDGRPALDTAICGGAKEIFGPRTLGSSVYAYVQQPGGPDQPYDPGPTGAHAAKMTLGGKASDPGARFAGTLRFPLITGQIVETIGLTESGDDYVYTSIERAVPACPGPPAHNDPICACGGPTPTPTAVAKPTTASDTTAPVATAKTPPKLAAKGKLDDLVKTGVGVGVTSSEDARAVATLSLQTPPATGKAASAVRKPKPKTTTKNKQPKVEVLGTATAQALAGKPLVLTVKASKTAKGKLKKAAKIKGAKLLVTVTLTDASGNTTTLPTTTVALPKK